MGGINWLIKNPVKEKMIAKIIVMTPGTFAPSLIAAPPKITAIIPKTIGRKNIETTPKIIPSAAKIIPVFLCIFL